MKFKKKSVIQILVVAAAFNCSGCTPSSVDSPDGVIAVAGKALQNDDYTLYVSSLKNGLQSPYGSEEFFNQMKTHFADFHDVKMTAFEKISGVPAESCEKYCYGDSVFRVELSGQKNGVNTKAFSGEITCSVYLVSVDVTPTSFFNSDYSESAGETCGISKIDPLAD